MWCYYATKELVFLDFSLFLFTKHGSFYRDFISAYTQQPKFQMISPRESASLWDTKLAGNFSCLSLKAVAACLVAIIWQTRISGPLRPGAHGECTGGFRSQNEVTWKCPLFSGNPSSLFWPQPYRNMLFFHFWQILSHTCWLLPWCLFSGVGAFTHSEWWGQLQGLLQSASSQLPTEKARVTGRYFIVPWHSIFLHHWQDHHPSKVHFQLSCLRRMKNYSS